MTVQALESLIYKGEQTWMTTEPLNQYLVTRESVQFESHSTACWRGYYGSWEIVDDQLFLIGFKAYVHLVKEVDLNFLFPGQKKVFADWFSGIIHIPQSRLIETIQMEYSSVFNRELFLTIKNGVVVEVVEIDIRKNSIPTSLKKKILLENLRFFTGGSAPNEN